MMLQRDFFARKVDTNLYAVGMIMPPGDRPCATRKLESKLFAGPQEEKEARALAPGLELVKDSAGCHPVQAPVLAGRCSTPCSTTGAGDRCARGADPDRVYVNASAYRSMAKIRRAQGGELKERPSQAAADAQRFAHHP
jgi:YidC/Oxa1 family membrane protein insertase